MIVIINLFFLLFFFRFPQILGAKPQQTEASKHGIASDDAATANKRQQADTLHTICENVVQFRR